MKDWRDDIAKNLDRASENSCIRTSHKTLTFKEAHALVWAMQQLFIEKKINQNPVVICGHKDPEVALAMIALAISGIPWVVLDDSLPLFRQKEILDQIQPQFSFGRRIFTGLPNITPEEVKDCALLPGILKKNPWPKNPLAYIIFTSGTTGKPKGIQISHQAISSLNNWLLAELSPLESRILNQAPFSFDLSLADFLLSFNGGKEYCLLTSKQQRELTPVLKQLSDDIPTLAVMTPGYASWLLLDQTFNGRHCPGLRRIVFCGERLQPKLVLRLWARFPDLKIYNAYGPSEATFAVSMVQITPEMCEKTMLPTGKIKPGMTVTFRDEDGKTSKQGEIILEGDSVGLGYLGDATGFEKGEHFNRYCTGDIGKMEDGLLYFLGRRDRQVKYKGYRIELDDIEANLLKVKEVQQVLTVIKSDEAKAVQRLIAYVVLKEGSFMPEKELYQKLAQFLPAYMMPALKIVSSIPLNAHGKVKGA
ncbi:MAG: AMP-binding protein [Erysipelotrichaceae bacterium]|jgi:D-alanine--poly(phosphoribitol) ligase subunit 1|nr:AMP-binding protein [Erysipelotrichaceae bacterium]